MFKTVVVALDGSSSSDEAFGRALDLARESGGRIVGVHVKELTAGRFAGPVHVDEDEILSHVRRQIDEAAKAGIPATLEVHTSMTGGPAHIVGEAAERLGGDVIVCGTRGHTALAGIFLGSVAQRLPHVAPCPILIVPDPQPAQPSTAPAGDEVAVS